MLKPAPTFVKKRLGLLMLVAVENPPVLMVLAAFAWFSCCTFPVASSNNNKNYNQGIAVL